MDSEIENIKDRINSFLIKDEIPDLPQAEIDDGISYFRNMVNEIEKKTEPKRSYKKYDDAAFQDDLKAFDQKYMHSDEIDVK